MTARLLRLTVIALASLPIASCAVGHFIAGAPPSGAATTQALLVRRCSGCHETPDPAAMTAAEWKASLEKMHRRIRLPEGEWNALAAMARSDSTR